MNIDFVLGDFSGSELVGRARAMLPTLRERGRRQWQQDHVLPETIDELKAAGLFRMLQPARFGGAQASLSEFYEVVSTIAEADPSVAWVVSVVGVHSFHVALLNDQAQQEVWGKDPQALIGSPYTPNGRAVPVEGGYRLKGKWSFSSGSKHCDWTFLGAMVEDGTQPDPTVRYQKNQVAFLLPRSDYQILDNWEVHGLCASGSHDIVVEDAFVPSHRMLSFPDLINQTAPGHSMYPDSVYQQSFFQVFPRATSLPVAVGALKGMADAVVEYGRRRNTTTLVRAGSTTTATDPAVALAVAQAYDEVDQLKGSMHRSFALLERWRQEGTADQHMNERRMFRYQTGAAPARCADLASELYRVCGGSGLSAKLQFGRLMNDILAVRSHITNNYQPHASGWFSELIGGPAYGWPV
jgi:3-hydroxy-9,10-secoandrosta-1,3,5(10)-triene-9,17-dione monooxygenase